MCVWGGDGGREARELSRGATPVCCTQVGQSRPRLFCFFFLSFAVDAQAGDGRSARKQETGENGMKTRKYFWGKDKTAGTRVLSFSQHGHVQVLRSQGAGARGHRKRRVTCQNISRWPHQAAYLRVTVILCCDFRSRIP